MGSSLPRVCGIPSADTRPACSSSLRTPFAGKFCVCFQTCFFPPSLNKPNIVRDAVVLCGARALLCFPPWPRPEIKRVGIWVGGGVGSETNFISSFLKANFGIEISSQICSCVCVFLAVKKIGRNSILSGFQVSPGLTESFM